MEKQRPSCDGVHPRSAGNHTPLLKFHLDANSPAFCRERDATA